MAAGDPLTDTYLTTGANSAEGQREDLTDFIVRIDPAETPGYSNYRKGTQRAIKHEWQRQLLAALDTGGKKEGYDLHRDGGDFDAAIPTTRPHNYSQIIAENWLVSGTTENVNKAGRGKETVMQRTLKGLELRRNIEGKIHDNQVPSGTDPRLLGGLITWILTGNWGSGVGAAAPDHTASVPTTAAVIDTPDAIDGDWWKAKLNPVLETIYLNGGKPGMMMMTPKAKRQFSEAGTGGAPAPSGFDHSGKKAATSFIGAIDVYMSDYGALDITINRFTPGAHLVNPADSPNPYGYESTFIIDRRQLHVVSLPGRSFMSEPLPKTGDAFKGHILWEGSLRVDADLAHGFIATP